MSLIQSAARKTSGMLGRESWVIRHLRPAYESLLDLSGKGIPWAINGVTYRIDPRYRDRFGHNYDAPVAAFLRERVKPGALCIDVGANAGVYVLQFAYWSGPNGRVIAFEPNPYACELLQRHIELNNLTERVEVVPAAVSSEDGTATMFAADSDGMSRLGAPNELIADRVKEITVPVVTLGGFCEERKLRPDWLFIDIEGFEIAALKGASRLIKESARDLNIVVEMHPNLWASAHTTRASAEDVLADLGLIAVPLTGQSDPLGEYGLVYLEHV